MLKIRLQRVGRKHDPSYRVVLTNSQNGPQSGKFLEILGSYDARTNVTEFKGDAIKEWIAKGAQVSDTVHNLLVKQGVLSEKTINVLPKKTPIKKEVEETEEAPAETSAEAPAEENTEEASTEEASTEEAPKEEAPVEETPQEEAPTPEEKPEEEAKEEAAA